MPISKTIKVRIDYSKESHADYALFVAGVVKNLTGNPHFAKPPIDLAVLKVLLQYQQGSIRFGRLHFDPIMKTVSQIVGCFPQRHPMAGDRGVGGGCESGRRFL